MVSEAAVENDIIALLRKRKGVVVAADMKDFRSKLKSSGIKLTMLEGILKELRSRRVIRLKRCEAGTRVRLRAQYLQKAA